MRDPKNDKFKLLINMDPNIPLFFFHNKPTKDDLFYIIDRLHMAEIDIFSLCVFTEGFTIIKNSRFAASGPFGGSAYDIFYSAGEDPIDHYIDRCHMHGMRFMAGFRMNDRHASQKGAFQEDHPEWQLWPEGGPYEKGAMNFYYPQVREWILGMMKEAAEKYDIDGLELDYMRWCHVFPPDKAELYSPILTGFMRDIRGMLDEAGKAKGRRLLLGVRIPQRMKDIKELGYDLRAWIDDGSADYICPSDFMYTDFNAPYEEFANLAGSTGCRVYPSVHPVISDRISGALMTRAHYRAIAERYHAAGVHGISLYNFQYHWQQCVDLRYPGVPSDFTDMLKFIKELRDPDTVQKNTRHYIFYPLWENITGGEATPPSGVKGVEGVSRMLTVGKTDTGNRKVFMFFLGIKDCPGQSNWQLLFNAVYMTENDKYIIDINGEQICPDEIQISFHPEGLNVSHRRPLGPYAKVRVFLGGVPLKQGKNELGFRLLKYDADGEESIEIQETEVIIEP